jgi:hypothetical protein
MIFVFLFSQLPKKHGPNADLQPKSKENKNITKKNQFMTHFIYAVFLCRRDEHEGENNADVNNPDQEVHANNLHLNPAKYPGEIYEENKDKAYHPVVSKVQYVCASLNCFFFYTSDVCLFCASSHQHKRVSFHAL